MADLKVGGPRAYQPYREVEAVPAYPNINPQQPHERYPVSPYPDGAGRDDQPRRRFRAMRRLIDELKKTSTISRVDYQTAEAELREVGSTIAEQELVPLLLAHKMTIAEVESLFLSMRQQLAQPDLRTGASLPEERNFLPVFVPGLLEGLLCFQQLTLPPAVGNAQIAQFLGDEGLYSTIDHRVGLEIIKTSEGSDALSLNIRLLVAIGEVDDAGRRVLLYQRPDGSYGLYADKHIDLSI